MSIAWRWHPTTCSVVIPTYNRLAVLQRVLHGLERQTIAPTAFEVIVVDDGSTDGTPDALAAYQRSGRLRLTVIQQANGGPAAARNAGLRRATAAIVIFVDDDCIPEPALVAEHWATHTTPGLAVIGRIVWHPDQPVSPLMAFAEREMFAYQRITQLDDAPFMCFYTGNASVDRERALAAGGFDEVFPRAMHEDLELGYRLRQAGVRFIYNPAAIVLHDRSLTLEQLLARQRLAGREVLRFWHRHPELESLLPFDQLTTVAWRRHFYRVVLGTGLMYGVQAALGVTDAFDPAESLPAGFVDQAPLYAEPANLDDLLSREEHHRRRHFIWAERDQLQLLLDDVRQAADRLDELATALEHRLTVRNQRPLLGRLTSRAEPPEPVDARPATPAPPPWLGPPPPRWPPTSLSVIIVALGEPVDLTPLVTALAGQTLAAEHFEVIVMVDEPQSPLAATLQSLRARLAFRLTVGHPTTRHPALARNQAMEQAAGDIVLFLGASTIPTPTCLAEHLRQHTIEGLAVVGRIVDAPADSASAAEHSPLVRLADLSNPFAESGLPAPFTEPFAGFSAEHASLQRAPVLALGGFDAGFPAATLEDFDLAYRLSQAGTLFTYCPAASVTRRLAIDTPTAFAQAQRRGRAFDRLLAHHPAIAAIGTGLIDRHLRERYYDVLAMHHVIQGIAEGLAEPARWSLPPGAPALFAAEVVQHQAQARQQPADQTAAAAHLQQLLAETEAWLVSLRAELQQQRVAYRAKAAWVAEMADRLDAQRSAPRGATLGRLVGGRRGRPS